MQGRRAVFFLALAATIRSFGYAQPLKPVGVMGEQRAAHTATLLPNGKVLITGGFRKAADGRSQIYFSSAELYDPAKRTFRSTGPMTYRRCGHTATLLKNGLVLIAGGVADMGVLSSAELYNPAAGTFIPISSMSARRCDFTATLLTDGRVLLCGGGSRDALATAEIFNPSTKLFTVTGEMAAPRLAHTASLLPDGEVLVTGGSSHRYVVLATAELYNPATGKFHAVGDMEQPRYKHAAAEIEGGPVLILGGSTKDDWRGTLSAAERYDPAQGTFSRVPNLLHARFKMPEAVVTLKSGSILIAGGDSTLELLDPSTGESRIVASLGNPRYYGTATALQSGDVLIVGGYDDKLRSTNKAWLYTE
jgi:WD40 repeat protein